MHRLRGRLVRLLVTSSVLIGALQIGASPALAAGAAVYVPYGPVRVVDTRIGLGVAGKLHAASPASFFVAGSSGIPPEAVAVTGNLTVTGQTALGYLYLGPVPANDPTSSTLNFPAGDDRANGVTVALGDGGKLSLTFVSPNGAATTQAIFDVTGYFLAGSSGGSFLPVNPTRILDSRSATGLGGPFANHSTRSFQVTGGVIPPEAVAVTGNLTVTGQTALGYLYLGPVPANDPTSSTLNFPAGDDRANGVTVALGDGGKLSLTFVSPNGAATTQAIFDVTGYFLAGSSGGSFLPVNPTRILDSRSATGLGGPFANHSTRSFQVTGGVIPPEAVAVTGNLTVTGQTALGYLYLGPVPANDPTSSTLNFPAGDDRANGVTVALGDGGKLSLTFVSPNGAATTQAIFDVTGYFLAGSSAAPPSFPGMSIYRSSAWSHQSTSSWCVGASTQMMLNLITGAEDHSSANQSTYMNYALTHSRYVARVGAEVDGWAATLTAYGAGPYSVAGYPTEFDAIKAAATRMRVSGKPVGLVVMEGHHAWVMAGFISIGEDPAVSQNFAVVSVIVLAPYYGSTVYDPAPGTTEPPNVMVAKLTPYTDDFPTIWDGQYVIIQP